VLDIISFTVNETEDRKLALEAFLKIERAAIFGRWRRRRKTLYLYVDQLYAGQQARINLIRGYI
jgi:hypothetical protein